MFKRKKSLVIGKEGKRHTANQVQGAEKANGLQAAARGNTLCFMCMRLRKKGKKSLVIGKQGTRHTANQVQGTGKANGLQAPARGNALCFMGMRYPIGEKEKVIGHWKRMHKALQKMVHIVSQTSTDNLTNKYG